MAFALGLHRQGPRARLLVEGELSSEDFSTPVLASERRKPARVDLFAQNAARLEFLVGELERQARDGAPRDTLVEADNMAQLALRVGQPTLMNPSGAALARSDVVPLADVLGRLLLSDKTGVSSREWRERGALPGAGAGALECVFHWCAVAAFCELIVQPRELGPAVLCGMLEHPALPAATELLLLRVVCRAAYMLYRDRGSVAALAASGLLEHVLRRVAPVVHLRVGAYACDSLDPVTGIADLVLTLAADRNTLRAQAGPGSPLGGALAALAGADGADPALRAAAALAANLAAHQPALACSHCGARGRGAQLCGGCREQCYCTRDCQLAARPAHKERCLKGLVQGSGSFMTATALFDLLVEPQLNDVVCSDAFACRGGPEGQLVLVLDLYYDCHEVSLGLISKDEFCEPGGAADALLLRRSIRELATNLDQARHELRTRTLPQGMAWCAVRGPSSDIVLLPFPASPAGAGGQHATR